MAREYALNPHAAKEANNGGKRITEPGAYVGTFRAAWYEKNENGTEAVGFFFVSEQGQEAGPLMLYTHNGEGKELPSYKTLNALMACLRIRKMEVKVGKVSFYDFDARADVARDKETYPGLINKRIGVVLQGEEHEYNGETKKRLQFIAPFDAETRRMAAEILDSKEKAEQLDKFLSWFESNKWKQSKAKNAKSAARAAAPAAAAGDDFEDDIPF